MQFFLEAACVVVQGMARFSPLGSSLDSPLEMHSRVRFLESEWYAIGYVAVLCVCPKQRMMAQKILLCESSTRQGCKRYGS